MCLLLPANRCRAELPCRQSQATGNASVARARRYLLARRHLPRRQGGLQLLRRRSAGSWPSPAAGMPDIEGQVSRQSSPPSRGSACVRVPTVPHRSAPMAGRMLTPHLGGRPIDRRVDPFRPAGPCQLNGSSSASTALAAKAPFIDDELAAAVPKYESSQEIQQGC